jgi:hypothetical protein
MGAFVRFEGVFAPLAAIEAFAQLCVNADLGTVTWPNGADIAPERLYDELLRQNPSLTLRL